MDLLERMHGELTVENGESGSCSTPRMIGISEVELILLYFYSEGVEKIAHYQQEELTLFLQWLEGLIRGRSDGGLSVKLLDVHKVLICLCLMRILDGMCRQCPQMTAGQRPTVLQEWLVPRLEQLIFVLELVRNAETRGRRFVRSLAGYFITSTYGVLAQYKMELQQWRLRKQQQEAAEEGVFERSDGFSAD